MTTRTFESRRNLPQGATPYGAHTARLLGGSRLVRRPTESPAEVHALLVRGIPYSTLIHLMSNLIVLSEDDVASAIGISTRTLRRQKDEPSKLMSADLGSRTWQFAETLALAEEIFGSGEAAERWMGSQVMGLDGARPIDLLRTHQGATLVNQFLERLRWGVYN